MTDTILVIAMVLLGVTALGLVFYAGLKILFHIFGKENDK